MDSEKEVTRRLEELQELGKEDKKVDVAALAADALAQAGRDRVSARAKYWAYLISASLPPVGLFFAAYHYIGGKSDGKKVALRCVVITVVIVLISWLLARQIMSSFGTELRQIQDVDLNAYKELLQ